MKQKYSIESFENKIFLNEITVLYTNGGQQS